ncbi:protein FAM167A-like [Varanus komodoensis]|uniref:protein FAM167A-like n=1 Tax=Varanus komodoensis TaxID=61221 RepID=UPI001CF7E8A1|nr:protein FAM167A-like [Varanus komodoensis]
MKRQGQAFPELESGRDSLEPGAEDPPADTWPWSNDEEDPPFKGLPPLPKLFRKCSLSASCLPGKEQQEDDGAFDESRSSLQDKMTWLHGELLRLRLEDLELFNQLYTLALEIQDLKELHQEMEAFSKEEQPPTEQGQRAEEGARSAAAFELTI